MSASAIASILAIVASLVGFGVWWFKKRCELPTPEEELAQKKEELYELSEEMHEARKRGDHAAAESLRRRLHKLYQNIETLRLKIESGKRSRDDHS